MTGRLKRWIDSLKLGLRRARGLDDRSRYVLVEREQLEELLAEVERGKRP